MEASPPRSGAEGGADLGLVAVVLLAVGVAAVDHEGGLESLGLEGLADFADAFMIVVGADGAAAAEDDVAGLVALRRDDGAVAGLGDGEKTVGLLGGLDRVDGDLVVAAGAVLETDGHGEAAGELAVELALGGAAPMRPRR